MSARGEARAAEAHYRHAGGRRPDPPFRIGDRVIVDSVLTKQGRVGGDRGRVESLAYSLSMERFDVTVQMDRFLRHRLTFAAHRLHLEDPL